ncbi:unnamed protein product, partial [Meganyctiphanes norvegica]
MPDISHDTNRNQNTYHYKPRETHAKLDKCPAACTAYWIQPQRLNDSGSRHLLSSALARNWPRRFVLATTRWITRQNLARPRPPTNIIQSLGCIIFTDLLYCGNNEEPPINIILYYINHRSLGMAGTNRGHRNCGLVTISRSCPWYRNIVSDHSQHVRRTQCLGHLNGHGVLRLPEHMVGLIPHRIRLSEQIDELIMALLLRRQRLTTGQYYTLMPQLREDKVKFFSYFFIAINITHHGHHLTSGTDTQWGRVRRASPGMCSRPNCGLAPWDGRDKAENYYGTAAPGGIVSSYICAGDGGNDSCMGDSGGPLVLKINNVWTQIGVVSWGIGCGKGHYPGVYSRLPTFLPWINRVKAIYR